MRIVLILLIFLLAACGRNVSPAATQTPIETKTATVTSLTTNTPTKKPTLTRETKAVTPIPSATANLAITQSASPTPTKVTWSYSGLGPIAYIQGYEYEIRMTNSGSSGDQVLYSLPAGNYDIDLTAGLSWSPDGSRLAYATTIWADIYLIFIDDSRVRNITNTGDKFETDPAWSPNGDKIAFSANRSEDKFNIHLMSPDGTNIEQLTNCPIYCSQPTWSPDGTTIAFVSEQNASSYDIFTIKADGSGQKQITHGGANLYPAWSPDGQYIAFARSLDVNETAYLYLVKTDGTGLTALTGDPDNIRRLSWSPDSRYIVYENFPTVGPIAALWIIDVQSKQSKPLTTSSGFYAPAWQAGTGISQEDIIQHPDCSSGWTRLVAGGQVRVMGAPTDPPNRVRSEPVKANNTIGQVYPGAILRLLEGPVCADGLIFWKVSNATIPSGVGWTAEGDGKEYWLEPYNP